MPKLEELLKTPEWSQAIADSDQFRKGFDETLKHDALIASFERIAAEETK